MDKIWDKVP